MEQFTVNLTTLGHTDLVSKCGDQTAHTSRSKCSVRLEHEVSSGAHNDTSGQGGILDINSLEPPATSKYGRGNEGADCCCQQGDVGVDVGPEHGLCVIGFREGILLNF